MAWPVFDVAASAIAYPFPYSDDAARWTAKHDAITRAEMEIIERARREDDLPARGLLRP